jgi:hypothetical protein
MTRSSTLALVTLLAGLLSLVSVASVSAGASCTGYAQEHCEAMATANDVTLFSDTIAPTPVHILSGRGIGQEHYEAMMTETVSAFEISAPVVIAPHLPGYAPEHFEEITSK